MKNKILLSIISLFSSISLAEVKIAVVDNFKSYHGKAVYEIVEKNSHKDVKITKFHFDGYNVENYYKQLRKIRDGNFDIINLSFGSDSYDTQESVLLREISEKGTIIVVAAGNNNQRLGGKFKIYPCALKIDNLYCIGAGDKEKAPLSNYGFGVTYFLSGKYSDKDMTSFSAPRFTALLSFLVKKPMVNKESFLEAISIKKEHNHDTLSFINLDFAIANLSNYDVAYNTKGPF